MSIPQLIKLLWDFRGEASEQTAIHHAKHLQEYADLNKLQHPIAGTDKVSDLHNCAFLIVAKEEMIPVRDALKPHRGVIYKES